MGPEFDKYQQDPRQLTFACADRGNRQQQGHSDPISASESTLQAPRNASRPVDPLPPYVRGPNYAYILSEADRDNGITYLPSAERLRMAVDKLNRGMSLIVAILWNAEASGFRLFPMNKHRGCVLVSSAARAMQPFNTIPHSTTDRQPMNALSVLCRTVLVLVVPSCKLPLDLPLDPVAALPASLSRPTSSV